MTKQRIKKLRRRERRWARRHALDGVVMQSGFVGYYASVVFIECEEWRCGWYSGISRSVEEWERRAAYGGRKGRKARRVLQRDGRLRAEADRVLERIDWSSSYPALDSGSDAVPR